MVVDEARDCCSQLLARRLFQVLWEGTTRPASHRCGRSLPVTFDLWTTGTDLTRRSEHMYHMNP